MSAQDTIRELLHREPFEPFRVVTSSGESYVVRNPDLVALMKSRLFMAFPTDDRWTMVLYLHITAVEAVNGRARHGPTRRRRAR
jgi:hypothetical protein